MKKLIMILAAILCLGVTVWAGGMCVRCSHSTVEGKNITLDCCKCSGTGKLSADRDCYFCNGTGKRTVWRDQCTHCGYMAWGDQTCN